MRTLIILTFAGFFSLISFSQSYCYTDNNETGNTVTAKSLFVCGEQEYYTPSNKEETPIITVRIDFHIFQKDDGSANFLENPMDIAVLNDFKDKINNRFSNLDPLDMGNSIYIKDARIRIVLEGIYFHPHTTDWDFSPITSTNIIYQKYVINDFDNYGFTNDQKNNVEHILFTGASGSLGGVTYGLGNQGYIVEKGALNSYNNNETHNIVGNLTHEILHSFG